MKKIAVLILTYNEEKNIADCIASAAFADEIIVIDSGSSDATVEIAEKLGAKVTVNKMEGFAAQRNLALTKTDAEWVFYLDADERVTKEAAQEIREVIELEPFAYEIKRMNIVFGKLMKHGGHGPDYSMRLYPRNAVKWEGKVHEHAVLSLPIKRLKNVMMHHTYTDWDRYIFKLNQYTSMMAGQMNERGKRANLLDFVIRPPYATFRFYVLKAGFLDGRMGLILALMHGFYTLTKYVKLYSKNKQ